MSEDHEPKATGGNYNYLVRDLLHRVHELEDRMNTLTQELTNVRLTMNIGISGGASTAIKEIKDTIETMKADIAELESQSQRFAGGSAVAYSILTVVGAAIGWVVSHLSLK